MFYIAKTYSGFFLNKRISIDIKNLKTKKDDIYSITNISN